MRKIALYGACMFLETRFLDKIKIFDRPSKILTTIRGTLVEDPFYNNVYSLNFLAQICELQKSPPPLNYPEFKNCKLLQRFMSNELNSLVDLYPENGWLSNLLLLMFLIILSPTKNMNID